MLSNVYIHSYSSQYFKMAERVLWRCLCSNLSDWNFPNSMFLLESIVTLHRQGAASICSLDPYQHASGCQGCDPHPRWRLILLQMLIFNLLKQNRAGQLQWFVDRGWLPVQGETVCFVGELSSGWSLSKQSLFAQLVITLWSKYMASNGHLSAISMANQ